MKSSKKKKKTKRLPVMSEMCSTCPFRKGSKYAYLVPDLTVSAFSEASRICHSTGSNAINENTGKPEKLCRGARDVQIQFFHRLGVINKPSDQAWEETCERMGL
jgi:hypothetical protein